MEKLEKLKLKCQIKKMVSNNRIKWEEETRKKSINKQRKSSKRERRKIKEIEE